jgi:predicted porin
MLRADLDAGLSFQVRETDFPDSDYGRTGRSQRSASLDLDYQPSPRTSLYAFYTYQLGRNRQGSIAQSPTAVTIGQVTSLGTVTPGNAIEIGSAPGGPVYPLLQAWTLDSEDRNHVVGVGLKREFGKASLNLDYTFSSGRTRITYDYTVGGALSAANAVFAGSGMPDLAIDTDYLDTSLRYPLTDRLAVRLFWRYQREHIRDWHYQNLDLVPVVGAPAALPSAVILDSGPHDYEVGWYGIMMQIEL